MSLISIFDSVTVEADKFLTEEDKVFFEQLQIDYTRTQEQLKKSFIFLKNHKRDFAPDGPVQTEALIKKLFNPPFEEISDRIQSLKEVFIKEVVRYINSTYNLNFVADHCLNANTYKEVITILLDKAEGGFFEQALDLAVKKFRGVAYSKKNKLHGNIVTLGNYSLARSESQFVNQHFDPYRFLMIIAGWIETNKLIAFPTFEKALHAQLEPSSHWIPSGGLKLTAFRLYANKRIDLQFASSEIATEFFTRMKLEPNL